MRLDGQLAIVDGRPHVFYLSAGADVSHRGGEPGFVHLSGDQDLVFPDYSGNNLFNTFGNLEVNAAAGILFIDFERGATLQLTGRAEVLWEGTQRAVRFEIVEAVELDAGVRVHWNLLMRTPSNLPAPRPTV